MHRAVIGLAAIALAAVFVTVPLTGPPSAVAEPVASANFYVAGFGDDSETNTCTASDAPCLTVSGAITRAQSAIDNGADDVTVNIAAGTYNENVAIGTVKPDHSLILIGADAATTTIRGLGTTSVVNITSGVVNITGLTVTGGESDSGGGVYNYLGELTISDSVVSGNTASGDTADEGGGGIYNHGGTVTVADSTVSDNTATDSGGYAGGIFNRGTLNVSGSTLSDNSGWYVGGIHNRGTLNVSDSTLSGNVATKIFGGGISNFEGTMTLTGSTLSGNSAPLGNGGAIYNKGTATVSNSTLSGNSAYQGGGIWTRSNLLTLTNSTLSANTQTFSRFGGVAPGGGIFADASPGINISNSILSESSCNQVSTVIDGGYNVSDEDCFWTNNVNDTTIESSTTIGLAPLAANGSTGPWTMAIDESSSAHHLVAAEECATTDQRGLTRPGFGDDANCDAGAYELQAVAPAVTTDPESQTLAIDSDATFTAEASGTPTPTVTWQTYTDDAWVNIPEETTTTLTLENVTHAMSGSQYRAVFTNGIGSDVTTAVATLTVPVGALDYLILTPSSATTVAGVSQAFAAEGFDAYDNSLGDVTGETTFTGSGGLDCEEGFCTATVADTYTVTATNGSATDTTTLTVEAGALDHLVVTPNSGTIVAGGLQAFAAEGFDAYDNSLGDVTDATVFSGSDGLECADGSCTATVADTYTITATNGTVTGTATLTVTPIPEVDLPETVPGSSGPLIGVPAGSSPGDTFTVTGAGFAPNAPVTFGIYSTPQTLGHAKADANGTATAVLKIPAGFSGKHTIVAAGMDPSLTPLYLTSTVVITATESGDDSQLVATGLGANMSGLGAMAALLLGLGSLVVGIAALRRRQTVV